MMPGSCREGKPEIDRGFGGLGGFSRIDLEKIRANPRKSAASAKSAVYCNCHFCSTWEVAPGFGGHKALGGAPGEVKTARNPFVALLTPDVQASDAPALIRVGPSRTA
jgi:hypothetical protein